MTAKKATERICEVANDVADLVDSRYYDDIMFQKNCAVSQYYEYGEDARPEIEKTLQQVKLLKKIMLLEQQLSYEFA